MSESDPIEVARRTNDAFSAMPFEQLREIVLGSNSYEEVTAKARELGREELVESVDPEIEVEAGGFGGGAALSGGRGFDAWLKFWREWLEPWEDLEFEATRYEGIGEWVIVDARVTARGGMSGVPVELEVCQLWRIRDGLAVRYEVHETHDQARAAIDAADRQPAGE